MQPGRRTSMFSSQEKEYSNKDEATNRKVNIEDPTPRDGGDDGPADERPESS